MRFFLKTCLVFHRSLMGLNLNTYSGRLPKWGSMLSGDIYEHRIVERHTSANGGSAWPTPRAGETSDQTSRPGYFFGLTSAVQMWPTPQAFDANTIERDRSKIDFSKGGHRNLREEIKINWATPNAADQQGTHGGGQGRSLRTDTHGMGGQLNPDFVELLMGFPVGWTSLDGLPVPVKINTPTSHRGSRAQKRQTGRHVSKRWAMRLCHKLRSRCSQPSTNGLRRRIRNG